MKKQTIEVKELKKLTLKKGETLLITLYKDIDPVTRSRLEQIFHDIFFPQGISCMFGVEGIIKEMTVVKGDKKWQNKVDKIKN